MNHDYLNYDPYDDDYDPDKINDSDQDYDLNMITMMIQAMTIMMIRFEKGRISQSNTGTLLVLPGTTVKPFNIIHHHYYHHSQIA